MLFNNIAICYRAYLQTIQLDKVQKLKCHLNLQNFYCQLSMIKTVQTLEVNLYASYQPVKICQWPVTFSMSKNLENPASHMDFSLTMVMCRWKRVKFNLKSMLMLRSQIITKWAYEISTTGCVQILFVIYMYCYNGVLQKTWFMF